MQGYKVTRLQGYKVTRLQGYKVIRLQGYKAPRLQGFKVTRFQNVKISPLTESSKTHFGLNSSPISTQKVPKEKLFNGLKYFYI